METIKTDRRSFLTKGAAGGLWIASLQHFAARGAYADPTATGQSPYGPVSPKLDGTTGLPLILLPEGFSYWSFSWTGQQMSDGVPCPNLHDGMAVVDEWHGSLPGIDPIDDGATRLVLVRNHETGGGAPYVNRPEITYRNDGAGGTTNLIFNVTTGLFERAWSTLAGTIRNCAGGVTPWATWITCEETTLPFHGWNFEVGSEIGDPTPLVDMGRFSHEALMVDPLTGYVYETEDSDDCGFYKFVPNRKANLKAGGTLYMLKVKGASNVDLGASYGIGHTWDVEWVLIDDPTSAPVSVFQQGYAKGAAKFRRLEGCWWGERGRANVGYFLSTDGGWPVSGGSRGEGQVFEYDPYNETLKLIYEVTSAQHLENPDNMVVTPRNGLLFCEDNANADVIRPGERLVGMAFDGSTFTFAVNNINFTQPGFGAPPHPGIAPVDHRTNEWAGACYSPDGKWLFANIQTPGVTFAITGPWGAGPL